MQKFIFRSRLNPIAAALLAAYCAPALAAGEFTPVDLAGSKAYAISGDGAVMVGDVVSPGESYEGFRWSAGSLTQASGIPGAGSQSHAYAVSADGSVIVGQSGTEAFRWTAAGGMSGLGYLDGANISLARSVSADGSVVVGYSEASGIKNAFRWNSTSGMQSVDNWLAAGGVALPSGWRLNEATSVSSNGNVVVGSGTSPSGTTQAWLARVGPASGIILDMPAFNTSLAEVGGRATQASTALMDFALFGAHHRNLLDAGTVRTGSDTCMWVTADTARSSRYGSSLDLSEIGLCKDFGPHRAGLGVGYGRSSQDMTLGGNSRHEGQYLVAELASDLGLGRVLSLTGYYGRFDARFDRRYDNGAVIDRSTANSHSTSRALRLRMEWNDLFALGKMRFGPYASYSHLKSELDGFSETGGAFPASYSAITTRIDDWRLGLGGKMPLSSSTDLKAMVAVLWRDNRTDSNVHGQLVDLGSFAFASDDASKTWTQASFDIDHRLSNKTVLTVGARTFTAADDWKWGLTAGLRSSF